MWTLSANATAQSAAAAVAFFNGDVGDDRVIGIDRQGVDWGTVGSWAALRERGGNAEPHRIALWEFGNEVYGGRPDEWRRAVRGLRLGGGLDVRRCRVRDR
jgi:hypothetical protein